MKDGISEEAIRYVEELFQTNSDGHGIDHTMRVWRNAMKIAEKEECDKEIVSLASLLHDADDHKLFHTENNANARFFLEKHDVDPDVIETIIGIINSVSFSQNRGRHPNKIEGMIVQDGDRLDAIGAIGIARTFLYSGSHGRSIQDSVAHFHEKLLLLKDEMNTDTGRRLAQERHEFLLSFLKQLEEEMR